MTSKTCRAPEDLCQKILGRIHQEQKSEAIQMTAVFATALIASAAAIIPAFQLVSSQMEYSGFLQFLALLFSDFSTVISYWKNFTMAVLESLPAVSIALFLAVALVCLHSLVSLKKNIYIALR